MPMLQDPVTQDRGMTSKNDGNVSTAQQMAYGAPIVAIMTGIFLVDTLSSLHIAIASLYILVLLVSAMVLPHRFVLSLCAACVVLTIAAFIISYAFTASPHTGSAFARCLVSLIAIVATTSIIIRSQAKVMDLADQIRILEQTHDAIIVRDMDYRITHWNQGAANLLGWTYEEASQKKCYELLSTTRRPSVAQAANELMANGRWEGEEAFRHKNGSTVQVSSRWSLQRNARGQATAIISASNDITAVRQAEEALSQAQAQLAHVMRVTMLGELMASIAHEINQPLAAIAAHGGASLRWLDRRPPNLAEVSVGLREITRDAERASEVIRRIRALSKKSDAVQQRLEMRGVIEEALALVEREILGKKITLLRSLMDEPLIINGDKVQLQQVIINLVINAAHAIDTRSDGPRIITVSSDRIGNRSAMVSVSDTGPGLSENDLPLLFDAFFTTRRDGMGLGLSICKSIVESNGGVIYARNNKAQGAQFRFLLPLAAAL